MDQPPSPIPAVPSHTWVIVLSLVSATTSLQEEVVISRSDIYVRQSLLRTVAINHFYSLAGRQENIYGHKSCSIIDQLQPEKEDGNQYVEYSSERVKLAAFFTLLSVGAPQ